MFTTDAAALLPPPPPPPDSLRHDSTLADITIKCGGETFQVHQNIVCPQSQKLRDACNAAAKVSPTHHSIPAHETDLSERQDETVVIHEDAFDAPTTKRMLEFLYHGEYHVAIAQESVTDDHDDNVVTKLDVLSHLFCYAIAESYQVEQLSTQALSKFSECLCMVSPDDFAELMGVIAAHTEEKPVHVALRSAASYRQDELAACKKFVKILGCGHIAEPATQDQGMVSDLRAAKQLAVHGATLFRIANRTTVVTTVERNRLAKSYQESLKQIEQLRSQVDKSSSTLVLDEQIQNDAKKELVASMAAEKHAKDELVASEERNSRMAQNMQKLKLELEVVRNAEHNNKLALEKANKEASAPRLALEKDLEGFKAELATLRAALEASLEANRTHVVNEQRMNAEIQRATRRQRTMAAELAKVKVQRDNAENDRLGAARGTNRIKNEFFESQKILARAKQERDEATTSLQGLEEDHEQTEADLFGVIKQLNQALEQRDQARMERDQATAEQGNADQTLEKINKELASQFNQVVAENTALNKVKQEHDQVVEEQKRTASKLEKAVEESARLRTQRDKVRAENTTLRTQARNNQTTISEGAKMLSVSTQQNEVMAHQAAQMANLRAEVNQVRLQNFTLQRSIYDLQFIILNNAENRQQLLEYGGTNLAPPQ